MYDQRNEWINKEDGIRNISELQVEHPLFLTKSTKLPPLLLSSLSLSFLLWNASHSAHHPPSGSLLPKISTKNPEYSSLFSPSLSGYSHASLESALTPAHSQSLEPHPVPLTLTHSLCKTFFFSIQPPCTPLKPYFLLFSLIVKDENIGNHGYIDTLILRIY